MPFGKTIYRSLLLTILLQQPHRRGLSHIHNDENAAPVTKQSLHQRHKSTGALYHTMSAATGLNAVAKRAAFGDVSNTSRALNHAKDDLVVSVKGNGQEYVKLQVLEKENALSRPAQRPLTATTKNSILGLNKANPSALANTSNKISAIPSVNPAQVVRPRASSKRMTAIYKDENSVKPQQISEPAKPQNIPVATAPIAPVHQTLGPRQHKSQPQLKLDQPILRRTQSKYMYNVLPTVLSDSIPSSSSLDFKDAPVTEEPKLPPAVTENYDIQSYDAPVQSVAKVDSIDTEPAVHTIDDYVHEERQLPALPSEPEEYWEEEEEVYDEQGYTTAHSYRSRGDNTTGGATTVMVPKLNTKVERELEAAKLIVEGSRTREEIEDDMWDTSMVAEYGDEIFGYMRELEVSAEFFICFGPSFGFHLSRSTCCRLDATYGPAQVHVTVDAATPPACLFTILHFGPILTNQTFRSSCPQTHTTWTTRPRFSGPCALFSWTG